MAHPERALGEQSSTLETVVMFSDTYSGKVVLVTGHTGFKGAWLSLWLQRIDANVVGYALQPPTVPSLFVASGLARSIEHLEGDVRDTKRLSDVIRRRQPEIIFHLAAAPLVRESYVNPAETFDVNVMGTVSLLDAVRKNRHACSLVIVSTDKCYKNQGWEYGYRESDPLGGHDPYSASKAAMEMAVASYRQSFFPPARVTTHGVRLASARAGNVIGGGDWSKDRIVPDAVRALSQGEPLEVRNPASVRPWQHVLEPLSGYLWLGAKLSAKGGEKFASSWNFGPLPTVTHTVGELAEALINSWNEGSWHAAHEENAPHEAELLKLSIDKANLHLKWEPVWDFATTVSRTMAWYQKFLAHPNCEQDIHCTCLDDIESYEDAAKHKELAWTR